MTNWLHSHRIFLPKGENSYKWPFNALLQEHNNALWAGHGQSFLSVKSCIIHTFRKISQTIKYEVKHFVKVIWKVAVGKQDWWEGTLIKLGDKDVSSTNGVRIDLVENQQTQTFAHL